MNASEVLRGRVPWLGGFIAPTPAVTASSVQWPIGARQPPAAV